MRIGLPQQALISISVPSILFLKSTVFFYNSHEAAANHAQIALNMLAKLEDEQKKDPTEM